MSIQLESIILPPRPISPTENPLNNVSSLYEKSLHTGEEVRVFRLVSIASDSIAGHLIVQDLNELHYSTLSYVWAPELRHPDECRCNECATDLPNHDGDHAEGCRCTLCHTGDCPCEHCQPLLKTIQCNGQRIDVQHNCWSALKHIGKQLLEEDLPIWVDAICINQRDEAEKRHQINDLMGKIYSKSEKGFIWLGEGNEHTDNAMEFLSRGGMPSGAIISHVGEPTHQQFPDRYSMVWKLTMQHLIWRLRRRYKPQYEGLQEIFEQPRLRNPWIRRLWTLQEAVLTKRSILVCGHSSIEWLAMVYAVDFIEFHRRAYSDTTFPAAFRDWKRLLVLWKRHTERNSISVRHSSMDPVLESHELLDSQLHHRRNLLRLAGITSMSLQLSIPIIGIAALCAILLGIIEAYTDLKYVEVPIIGFFILVSTCYVFWRIKWTQDLHTSDARDVNPSPIYTAKESSMIEIATREATNPKDKYKGILGITGKSTPWANTNEPRDLYSVYRALSVDLIRHTKSLNLLLFSSSVDLQHSRSCPTGQGAHLFRAGGQLVDCQLCMKREYCADCRGQRVCSSCSKSQKCGPCLRNRACGVCIAIARCGGCTRMDERPSWVVDWRQPDLIWFQALYSYSESRSIYTRMIQSLGTTTELRRYRGATAESEVPPIDFLASHMHVTGVIIGLLAYSQGLSPGDEDELFKEHVSSFMYAMTWPEQRSKLNYFERLYILRCLTRFARISHKPRQRQLHFDFWARHIAWVNRDDIQSTCDRLSGHSAPRNPLSKMISPGLRETHSAMVSFFNEKRLVLVRASDRRLGFGVAGYHARQGDKVALIRGVSLPLLLREQGDAYEIVSPALLPEVMDGTLWDNILERGRDLETITLV